MGSVLTVDLPSARYPQSAGRKDRNPNFNCITSE